MNIHNLFLFRAKFPVKVQVWAGISKRDPAGICIFEGIMDAPLYVEVRLTLLPFINKIYPINHRFMANNDPKHTSKEAKELLEASGVNWWRTPAKSPDCNLIENLWHKLKEYNRCVIKPTNKEQLIEGIKKFWKTVSVAKCNKYINYFKKVIPKVTELNDAATG